MCCDFESLSHTFDLNNKVEIGNLNRYYMYKNKSVLHSTLSTCFTPMTNDNSLVLMKTLNLL